MRYVSQIEDLGNGKCGMGNAEWDMGWGLGGEGMGWESEFGNGMGDWILNGMGGLRGKWRVGWGWEVYVQNCPYYIPP